jgi:DNA polymerase/3'-5' exonuclease PolX
LEEQNQILEIIKKKVQLGGDACLRRFNSFGAQEDSFSGSDNHEIQIQNISKYKKEMRNGPGSARNLIDSKDQLNNLSEDDS